MRIFSATLLLLAALCAPAFALDPSLPDATPREALREGLQAYFNGDKKRAATALEVAANEGHPLAQWKLGKMYAQGDGVGEDDAKAFDLFRRLASQHADDNPHTAMASVVANAFVELGNYYRRGLDSAGVKKNAGQAMNLFTHAAVYFGDPEAQFYLARMYLDGEGVARDPGRAIKWLGLAARKNHVPSQATLGDLLLHGGEVPARPDLGMMWLIVAKENAKPEDRDWVLGLHFQAQEKLDPATIDRASNMAADWIRRNRG